MSTASSAAGAGADSSAAALSRISRLWVAALAAGAAGFAAVVIWCVLANHVDLAMWLIAAGAAAASYNIAFYALAAAWAPELRARAGDPYEADLEDPALSDEALGPQGDETVDPALRFYVRAFIAARWVAIATLTSAILIGLALLALGGA